MVDLVSLLFSEQVPTTLKNIILPLPGNLRMFLHCQPVKLFRGDARGLQGQGVCFRTFREDV